MVQVVRKKDDHNKKSSHLILEMSMNEVFIWLSGHRIIDREIFNGYKSFPEFSLKIIPFWGPEKIY